MPERKDFYNQPTEPGVRFATPLPVLGAAATPAPSAETESASLSIPKQIGPYPIEGILSTGGMSRLYLAVHPETRDPLVVKVLLPKFLSHPELKERFLKEAEIIALADHPNIVKVYGNGEWEGGLYIAMEFIQGISLRQFILQNTVSLKRALEIVLQIAYAILHLHSHGVIHRDLKPENIILTSTGGIKVIDFGIAQLHESSEEEIQPQQAAFLGTPVYMSPEQKENPARASFPTDIYSLGIIAYELILGKISMGTVHLSLMPRGLQKILGQALQPDPTDRYSDIVDFIKDISDYLQSEAISKDKEGRGYAQDLAEHIRLAQEAVLPASVPNWPKVTIGLAAQKGPLNISGIYYDFLAFDAGDYGIILSEPSSKGVEGIIHCAILQGMVKALFASTTDPVQFVKQLNTLIVKRGFEQIYTLSYLILSPSTNKLHYISCGYGPLWLVRSGLTKPELISSPNIAIGIDPDADFLAVSHNWKMGDNLLLSTFKVTTESSSQHEGHETFEEALNELLYTTPQKQAEGILRKMLPATEIGAEKRATTIISIQRTS